jgi:hypothetical protein
MALATVALAQRAFLSGLVVTDLSWISREQSRV